MQLNLFGFDPPEKQKKSKKSPGLPAIHEYFLLISPEYQVKQSVRILKAKLNQTIGLSEENLFSVPHLSLMVLSRKNEQDGFVIENTRKALEGQSSFSIELNKAASFDHPHTNDLILNVENPEPVKKIFSNLSGIFDPGRVHSGFTPHITIGRNIPKKDFEKVSSSLNEFNLQTSFNCNAVTILRREWFGKEKTKYRVIKEVMLN
ncbi:MAG: 2'-5' RNA ligase family protein [Bacteroidetes bacterium]|nr:2'-5' RNA ligase family protein [Bacteroidota bacterium]